MQVSIIKKSAVVGNFRIDAECYQKKYVLTKKKLSALKNTLLGKEVSKFYKGIFDIKAESYSDSGVPFVRIGDLKDCIIDTSNITYIPQLEHLKNHKTALRKGDIILSKTAYPAASFVNLSECNTSQDTIAIRLKENSQIESEYLVVFLNSKFGFYQMERWFTGNVQMHLNLSDSRNIIIPIPSKTLQNTIKSLFFNVIWLKKQSVMEFNQAQTLLLSELGLADWEPKHRLTFVKSYFSAQRAERIDAEYFQPKYEEIVHAIKSYAGGWDKLGNLVTMKKCVEVGSREYLNEGIPFVRVSNLNPFEITEEKYISEALYEEIMQHQPEQGEILFSKDATPGIAYYLREQPPKIIPSGGILRLKSKTDKLNNEYLTLVLNSILTKEQVNRDVGGSVILHWRPDQVQGTVIPILPKEKQTQIQQKVTESFNLRKQSKHLLECAKRAVEMAIEQDEQTAIDWLEDETNSTAL